MLLRRLVQLVSGVAALVLASALVAEAQSARPAAVPGQQHVQSRDVQSAVQSHDLPEGDAWREFSPRDRRSVRECLVENRGSLPPGLAKRDRLPPGLERQVHKNGTLPPGLQKRVQPLPAVCGARLPRLPEKWEVVVLGRRVILLDPVRIIVDLFDLDKKS